MAVQMWLRNGIGRSTAFQKASLQEVEYARVWHRDRAGGMMEIAAREQQTLNMLKI